MSPPYLPSVRLVGKGRKGRLCASWARWEGGVDEDERVRVAMLHLCSGQLGCDSSRAGGRLGNRGVCADQNATRKPSFGECFRFDQRGARRETEALPEGRFPGRIL